MSAEDNLSPQFRIVYRGVHSDYLKNNKKSIDDTSDHSNLGIHWSLDKNVAANYAAGIEQGLSKNYYGDTKPEGLVYTARVAKEHIVPLGSDEWEHLASKHNIMDPGSHDFPEGEAEVTVRKGAPVDVLQVEKAEGKWGKFTHFGSVYPKSLRPVEFKKGQGTA